MQGSGICCRNSCIVGRRANHTVDQARIGIDANVGFIPKCHSFPFFV